MTELLKIRCLNDPFRYCVKEELITVISEFTEVHTEFKAITVHILNQNGISCTESLLGCEWLKTLIQISPPEALIPSNKPTVWHRTKPDGTTEETKGKGRKKKKAEEALQDTMF